MEDQEEIEQQEQDKIKRGQKKHWKRQIGMILMISWSVIVYLAWMYTQELTKRKDLEDAIQQIHTESEFSALQNDYASIWTALLQEQEKDTEREQVSELTLDFIRAYYLEPHSAGELLTACEPYVSEEVLEQLQAGADYLDYNDREKELFYMQQGSTEYEGADGNYYSFAIFTVREIEDGAAYDQSYMLCAVIQASGTDAQITALETMTPIYFHAD